MGRICGRSSRRTSLMGRFADATHEQQRLAGSNGRSYTPISPANLLQFLVHHGGPTVSAQLARPLDELHFTSQQAISGNASDFGIHRLSMSYRAGSPRSASRHASHHGPGEHSISQRLCRAGARRITHRGHIWCWRSPQLRRRHPATVGPAPPRNDPIGQLGLYTCALQPTGPAGKRHPEDDLGTPTSRLDM